MSIEKGFHVSTPSFVYTSATPLRGTASRNAASGLRGLQQGDAELGRQGRLAGGGRSLELDLTQDKAISQRNTLEKSGILLRKC
jgi:hypothetical protein